MFKTIQQIMAALVIVSWTTAANATFLLTERNASQIHTWSPVSTALYHTQRSNDIDINFAEGSSMGWIAEHFTDHFGSFVPGSNTGLANQYNLGAGGRTSYAYPKHISVFNNEVLVTSRNDGRIYRYDQSGNQLGSFASGFSTGQGMATDGTNLYFSGWNGANSVFNVYDLSFNLINQLVNPVGLGFNNIFDFAYDAATGDFFGLATNGEGGTGTQSNTVVQFQMGGGVVNTYGLSLFADGIGQFNTSQVPEPGTIALFGLGLVGLGFARRKKV